MTSHDTLDAAQIFCGRTTEKNEQISADALIDELRRLDATNVVVEYFIESRKASACYTTKACDVAESIEATFAQLPYGCVGVLAEHRTYVGRTDRFNFFAIATPENTQYLSGNRSATGPFTLAISYTSTKE